MKRAMITFFALAVPGLVIAELVVACGDDPKVLDAGGLDAPIWDVVQGPDCAAPQLTCLEGAPNKACGDFPQKFVVVDASGGCKIFGCGPGTVPVSQCACQAKTYNVEAGADCPSAGDAAVE